MAFTFIMQNIAANLGGMLTPFGNPQNLYIYTKYNISDLEFVGIMLPPFLLSVTLITVCCLVFVKSEPLVIHEKAASLPPIRVNLPASFPVFYFNRIQIYSISDRPYCYPAFSSLSRQTGSFGCRLRASVYLCFFLHLFGKYGAY